MGSPKTKLKPLEPISSAEAAEFDQCEARVEHLKESQLDAGGALKTIRDERLYRAEYFTFRLYVETRWKMSDRQADRLISAFDVYQNVVDNSGGVQTSSSETIPKSQLELLAKLQPDDQPRAMLLAKELAKHDGNRVSFRYVDAAVTSILTGNEPVVELPEIPVDAQQPNDADNLADYAIENLNDIDNDHPGKRHALLKVAAWIEEELRRMDVEAVTEATR